MGTLDCFHFCTCAYLSRLLALPFTERNRGLAHAAYLVGVASARDLRGINRSSQLLHVLRGQLDLRGLRSLLQPFCGLCPWDRNKVGCSVMIQASAIWPGVAPYLLATARNLSTSFRFFRKFSSEKRGKMAWMSPGSKSLGDWYLQSKTRFSSETSRWSISHTVQ